MGTAACLHSNEYYYTDNTNLEEVSDWITKIILGLTLIKLNSILHLIDISARSISKSLVGSCLINEIDYYVFSYSVITIYFFAGGGVCFLWTRTNLALILTDSRIRQMNKLKEENQRLEEKNKQLLTTGQKLITEISDSNYFLISENPLIKSVEIPSPQFKNEVEKYYNTKPLIDKTDPQRGRWGGKSQVGHLILEGRYDPKFNKGRFYGTILTVRSTDPKKPFEEEVAFFLHDTFLKEIEYTKSENNVAELKIASFEAFVVGATTASKIDLELDLNKVEGFPPNFYWK